VETFLKESFHTFKELPKKKFENSRYGYMKTYFQEAFAELFSKSDSRPSRPR